MILHTTKRTEDKERLKEIQRSVLESFTRGLVSERSAMNQLGIKNPEELTLMLNKAGLKPWEREDNLPRTGSIADGFAHYWQSQNQDE